MGGGLGGAAVWLGGGLGAPAGRAWLGGGGGGLGGPPPPPAAAAVGYAPALRPVIFGIALTFGLVRGPLAGGGGGPLGLGGGVGGVGAAACAAAAPAAT